MARPKKKKAKENKSKLKITLSHKTKQNLKKIAKKIKLSKTELIEDLVKGKIAITSYCATKSITFEESLKDSNLTNASQKQIKISNDRIKLKKAKNERDCQKKDFQFEEKANITPRHQNLINQKQGENHSLLQQKLVEQENINKELIKQLSKQKKQVTKYKELAEDNAKSKQELQQELAIKTGLVKQLEQKNLSLQSLARLGEYQLTKWQNRFFINN